MINTRLSRSVTTSVTIQPSSGWRVTTGRPLLKPDFLIIFAFFYTFYDLKVCKKLFLCQKIDFNQWTACGAPVCWLKYTTQLPKFYDSKGITNLSLSEYLLPHVHIMLRLFSVPEVPGSKAWPYFWRSCLCSHIVTIFLPDSGDVSSSNKDNKVIKI